MGDGVPGGSSHYRDSSRSVGGIGIRRTKKKRFVSEVKVFGVLIPCPLRPRGVLQLSSVGRFVQDPLNILFPSTCPKGSSSTGRSLLQSPGWSSCGEGHLTRRDRSTGPTVPTSLRSAPMTRDWVTKSLVQGASEPVGLSPKGSTDSPSYPFSLRSNCLRISG